MQIISKRLRDQEVDVAVESLDDLWYLQKFIQQNDTVRGEANRKVQINDKGATTRKQATVTLSIENVEVDLDTKVARLNGIILQGNEWFPQGSYQNVTLEIGSMCTIIKQWDNVSLQHLEQACSPQHNVLFVLFDRDQAIFFQRKGSSYHQLKKIQSDLDGKYSTQTSKSSFFEQIQETISMYDQRLDLICIGAPAFFHTHKFQSKTKQIWFDVTELTQESCTRMIRDKQVITILKQDITIQLSVAIDTVKQNLAKNQKVCYGINEVIEQCQMGSVETLLLTEKFVKEHKETANNCINLVETCKGTTLIIPEKTDEHKMVQGLSGMVAILRY